MIVGTMQLYFESKFSSRWRAVISSGDLVTLALKTTAPIYGDVSF